MLKNWQGMVILFQNFIIQLSENPDQGRPVYVKHGARCTMGKVGGDEKPN